MSRTSSLLGLVQPISCLHNLTLLSSLSHSQNNSSGRYSSLDGPFSKELLRLLETLRLSFPLSCSLRLFRKVLTVSSPKMLLRSDCMPPDRKSTRLNSSH